MVLVKIRLFLISQKYLFSGHYLLFLLSVFAFPICYEACLFDTKTYEKV